MKHDHFLDAGSFGLSCAPPEFGDVCVADRAINEAPELQMDDPLRIGEVYSLPGHGFHHRRRQHVSWLEFHIITLKWTDWSSTTRHDWTVKSNLFSVTECRRT